MKKEALYTEAIAQLALTVVKPLVFLLAVSPFAYALMHARLHVEIGSFLALLVTIILSPLIALISIATLFRLLPDVPDGNHVFSSYNHNVWLFKDLIHETVVTSAFLKNLAIRVLPIRYLFYSIIKAPNTKNIILANDVRILDPDRVQIGQFTFVGINTILSGHIIRSGRLVLKRIIIGEQNIIGAFCSIACGVTTGRNCKIDSFVTLNNDVIIGEKSIILGKSFIDSRVKIGANVKIGRHCIIGKNTVIEDGAIIKDYLRIGGNKLIHANEIVTTDIM